MFLTRFPLLFNAVATMSPEGELTFLKTRMILRYGRIPDRMELSPRFPNGAEALEPWVVEDVTPEGAPSGRLRLTLDGPLFTDLVNANPNYPLYLDLLDQSELHLPFRMGPIAPEEDCPDEFLRGAVVLRLCLTILSAPAGPPLAQ